MTDDLVEHPDPLPAAPRSLEEHREFWLSQLEDARREARKELSTSYISTLLFSLPPMLTFALFYGSSFSWVGSLLLFAAWLTLPGVFLIGVARRAQQQMAEAARDTPIAYWRERASRLENEAVAAEAGRALLPTFATFGAVIYAFFLTLPMSWPLWLFSASMGISGAVALFGMVSSAKRSKQKEQLRHAKAMVRELEARLQAWTPEEDPSDAVDIDAGGERRLPERTEEEEP
ncbi:MAG: hypothetical protein AAF449_02540 [Myxococcota bacterium]